MFLINKTGLDKRWLSLKGSGFLVRQMTSEGRL